MARRVAKNHYVASPRHHHSPTPVHVSRNAAYSDGEESQRAPSERTLSEYTSVPYTIVNERNGRRYNNHQKSSSYQNGQNTSTPMRAPSALSRGSGYETNGSDIYVTSGAYKAPSEISRNSRIRAPSHMSYRSGIAPSVTSTHKSRGSRKAGMRMEAMAAPNPFCPNIKGMCCLMLLLNFGIILVTLGMVIVIQFYDPLYVWVLGIIFLIFGFLTLVCSLIYCVVICREFKRPGDVNPDELYWTHHWQKSIGTVPEIHYKAEEKYGDDRYSDRYSVSKLSGKYSDKNGRY
ncbi:uncharacterized protein LOC114329387 [Diabrotica virgifera virgifera]|uniref:Uncharacterized protein LOC114329387 n=1 Tax=Diabrotica virgifera virgifera TaxID=50390 RepID=A0A6P7FH74_DIAVI|nr:uncharacterized protein LOC114329387 [Diabrotica virgifera virgifera]